MESVGVITGKFAPLHSGHICAITEASTQVDTLYVVLSYDQKFVDSQPIHLQDKLTLKKRTLWLKRTFKNISHIKVVVVDETYINPYPKGVEEWCSYVREVLLKEGVVNIDKWFSSEPEYSWWITKYFQEATHIIIDENRDSFNISATKIRSNPYKYWEFLPSIVRKEFLLKVCLIGEESCGKSTLTKYLSKLLNTSWVDEYGRTYCEQHMCMDESLLSFEDYVLITSNRYYEEQQAELTANKVLIVDTNAFITQYYCKMYEGSYHPLVDAYIEQEKYDVIIHLDSDVPWVDDGLRVNPDRDTTSKLFNKMLDKYEVRAHTDYHKVSGSYKERFDTSLKIIKDKLNIVNN